jgi:anti-sigma B factor antagonist
MLTEVTPARGKVVRMLTLDVEVTDLDRGMLVKIVGDAGVTQVAKLEHELSMVMLRRPALVVLDMAQMAFVSSLGMGALVSFRRSVTSHGGHVRLANVPSMIRDGFRRARLDLLFPMFDTVDAALEAPLPEAPAATTKPERPMVRPTT